MILVPPGSADRIGDERWAAISIAGLGFALELLWIGSNWVLDGSPPSTIDGPPPDVAPAGAFPLKRFRPLRWLARRFVPRIDLETRPQQPQA